MLRRLWRFGHRSRRQVSGLRPGGHEHDILWGDIDVVRRVLPLVLKPVDGHAVGRRREAKVLDKGAGQKVHALPVEPSDQGFYERFVLVELRAQDMRHGRQVREQVDEAVHVAPELDEAMLRQRPHERRPQQPKFRVKELRGEVLLDAPPLPPSFGRQREPRERQAVAPTQTVTRPTHGAQIAIDDMCLVHERVLFIESEELLFDGNVGVGFGGNIREQVESAAEFLVEDRPGKVVAALRTAAQKEAAAQLFIRLVDRDVLARYAGVPDEQRRRR